MTDVRLNGYLGRVVVFLYLDYFKNLKISNCWKWRLTNVFIVFWTWWDNDCYFSILFPKVSSFLKHLRYSNPISKDTYSSNPYPFPFYLLVPWDAVGVEMRDSIYCKYYMFSEGIIFIKWQLLLLQFPRMLSELSSAPALPSYSSLSSLFLPWEWR